MTLEATQHGEAPNGARALAGIGAVLYAIAALLSVMPAMMSAMLFDAPGSEKRVILWILVGFLLLLPLDLLAASIALGLAAWKRWRNITIVAFALPALHVVAIAGLFALM